MRTRQLRAETEMRGRCWHPCNLRDSFHSALSRPDWRAPFICWRHYGAHAMAVKSEPDIGLSRIPPHSPLYAAWKRNQQAAAPVFFNYFSRLRREKVERIRNLSYRFSGACPHWSSSAQPGINATTLHVKQQTIPLSLLLTTATLETPFYPSNHE